MEKERISLGDGIAVFRQYETWIVEVCRKGRRIRKSLGTRDKGEALAMATKLWQDLTKREQEIDWLDQDAQILFNKVLTNEKRHKEAIFEPEYASEPSDHRIGKSFVDAFYLTLHKLSALAGESVREEDTLRRVLREESTADPLPVVKNEKAIQEYGVYQMTFRRNQKDAEGKPGRWTKQAGNILREFCMEQKLENIGDITRDNVKAHLASLVAASTVRNHLTAIGGYLNWAKLEAKYVKENVAEGIEIGADNEKHEVHYHSSDEISQLLEAAEGEGHYELLIHFALYSNLRSEEIDAQQGEDVNPETSTINVTKPKKTRRGLKRRWAPLMDELLPVIMRLPRKGKLFPFSVQSGATNRALNRIWDKAGLPKEKYKRGLQVLRHSWVTHLLQHPARLNHNTVAQWAGHTPQVQQDRYNGLFRSGDTPWVMTCERHGIGKAKKIPKAR